MKILELCEPNILDDNSLNNLKEYIDYFGKKSKTIVTTIAALALVIAGVSSYDFNPVSLEQLEHAEKEVQNVSGGNTVYWAPHSKKYHVDPDCPAFSQSETVYEGTVKQAFEKGLTDPCRRCIPELEDCHDY